MLLFRSAECGLEAWGDRWSRPVNKSVMKEVEKRLERNPLLPKWDVLIRPV